MRRIAIGIFKTPHKAGTRLGRRADKPAADKRWLTEGLGIVPQASAHKAHFSRVNIIIGQQRNDLSQAFAAVGQQQSIKRYITQRIQTLKAAQGVFRYFVVALAKGVALRHQSAMPTVVIGQAAHHLTSIGRIGRIKRHARNIAANNRHRPTGLPCHRTAIGRTRRQNGNPRQAAFMREGDQAVDLLTRCMAEQVNAVAGHFSVGGKGDHIDPSGARLRCYGDHFLAEQRAEKKRRTARQQVFRGARCTSHSAAGIAWLQHEIRVRDIEQSQLRGVEKRRPFARQRPAKWQQQSDFNLGVIDQRRLFYFGRRDLGYHCKRKLFALRNTLVLGRHGLNRPVCTGRIFLRCTRLFAGRRGFVLSAARG